MRERRPSYDLVVRKNTLKSLCNTQRWKYILSTEFADINWLKQM